MERDERVLFRSRLTTRLRFRLGTAIAGSNRAVADVAGEYGVGWHTAHRAPVALAASVLPEPAPTAVLGVDETHARSLRWVLERDGWKRSDPWLTSFVDADPPARMLLARLDRVLATDDPADEISAAWAVKELLRQLLAERDPDRSRHRLWRFYDAAARVQMPEATRTKPVVSYL